MHTGKLTHNLVGEWANIKFPQELGGAQKREGLILNWNKYLLIEDEKTNIVNFIYIY